MAEKRKTTIGDLVRSDDPGEAMLGYLAMAYETGLEDGIVQQGWNVSFVIHRDGAGTGCLPMSGDPVATLTELLLAATSMAEGMGLPLHVVQEGLRRAWGDYHDQQRGMGRVGRRPATRRGRGKRGTR